MYAACMQDTKRHFGVLPLLLTHSVLKNVSLAYSSFYLLTAYKKMSVWRTSHALSQRTTKRHFGVLLIYLCDVYPPVVTYMWETKRQSAVPARVRCIHAHIHTSYMHTCTMYTYDAYMRPSPCARASQSASGGS
jgi:hypothetical protein